MSKCIHSYRLTLNDETGEFRVCCSCKVARLREQRNGRGADPSLWPETECTEPCGGYEPWDGQYNVEAVYSLCTELADGVSWHMRAYWLAHHWLPRAMGAGR